MYHLKITLRQLIKHKFSSLINIIGLTIGLTSAFFIYLWVQDEFSIDQFHEKNDRLYQVLSLQTYSNGKSVSNGTPGLLGQSLKTDFPDIQYSATTTWVYSELLSYENTFLREQGYHVDKDFFNIFTYPLLIGDPNTVLNERASICISRDLANKFFGSIEKAVGKNIRLGDAVNFTVSGVFENINSKSTYIFDFVLPLQDFLDQAPWANIWSNTGPPTYVVLQDGVSPQAVTEKISGYIKTKTTDSNTELFLKKYSDQYLQGRYTNGMPDGGRIDYVRLFSVIAIFIMIIACINFMNLSTARASKRAQEVGIRKAIGAGRMGLIGQYIGEAMLLAFLSMLLAFVLVIILLAPFNEITGKNISLSLTPGLLGLSIFTVVMTGILAGSYPAFYLSHFRPIQVIKNEIKSSIGEVWARKGLVIFQFTITIVLIVAVMVIHRQTQYLSNKPLGYNRDNVILFSQDGGITDRRETFFNELRKIPGVVHAGGTNHGLVGSVSSNPDLGWDGKLPEDQVVFERFFVDYDFYETMEFQMAEGRWFRREFTSDTTKVVINETAADAMGFSAQEAIGQRIQLSKDFLLEIVGVVKDFHYMSLHESVKPAYFHLENTSYVAARLEAGREEDALDRIQALYKKFAPGFIFDYSFLDRNYQALYESEKRVSTLSSYFAGFAIIISCLGLFGLVAFTAERRVKEIGIRKVLGATTSNIVLMLSKDFTQLVFVSIVIAVPIAYFFMLEWLAQFAYKIDLSIWIFFSAAMVSLVIALATVSLQALKAANVNPVKSLKSE
ncbi:MAG: ABC transporter permease [Saprospiraceae bacterium]